MQRAILPICLLCILFGVACEKKEILPGTREDFFANSESIKVDAKLSHANVTLSPATSVTSYTDIGGNEKHNSINHVMPASYKTAWKTKAGLVSSNLLHYQNNLYAVNKQGELVCIDTNSGNIIWKKLISPQKDGIIFSGGIAINNNAHKGIIFISTNNGEIIGIDLEQQKEVFKYDVKIPMRSAPIIKDGKIIVTTITNQTLAISINGKSKTWERIGIQEEAVMEGAGTPALHRNTIICAYTNGDVVAMDIQNGNELWADTLFSTDTSESGFTISHIVASPVIYGDNVLVGNSESKMAFIDMTSGIRLWEHAIGIINLPVISKDWGFILTSDNFLVCLSTNDGAVKWSSHIEKKDQWFGPLLINNNVVVFAKSGDIRIFNANSGKIISNEKIDLSISQTPIIVSKAMYIATTNGEIICLK